jgi:competence ComEA-like helix-hairpin-helix protein
MRYASMRYFFPILVFMCVALPTVASAALLNINTADVTTLESLPHIGPTLANRIIAYRTQNGDFATSADLQKVKGIGAGVHYAAIAPLITVSDMNVTTSATTTIIAPTPTKQPTVATTSYRQVQTVEPIISQPTNVQSHATTVQAPAASTELDAAGAAFPTMPAATAVSVTAPVTHLLHSPWTLGFVGIVILAGGAFIAL